MTRKDILNSFLNYLRTVNKYNYESQSDIIELLNTLHKTNEVRNCIAWEYVKFLGYDVITSDCKNYEVCDDRNVKQFIKVYVLPDGLLNKLISQKIANK